MKFIYTENWLTKIEFTDPRFQAEPVLIRIIGIKQNINVQDDIQIELSNEPIKRSQLFSNKGVDVGTTDGRYQRKIDASRVNQVLMAKSATMQKKIDELEAIIKNQ